MPGVKCSASLHRRHAAQHSCVHTNHLSMQMGLQTSSATIATFLLVLASFAGGAWDAGPALTLALFCLDVLRFWLLCHCLVGLSGCPAHARQRMI